MELRRKIRLRCYGPDYSFGVLEMKQKEGAMQKKRSLRMTPEDAKCLINRDYSVLLHYKEAFAQECFALMHLHCYVVKACFMCLVENLFFRFFLDFTRVTAFIGYKKRKNQ